MFPVRSHRPWSSVAPAFLAVAVSLPLLAMATMPAAAASHRPQAQIAAPSRVTVGVPFRATLRACVAPGVSFSSALGYSPKVWQYFSYPPAAPAAFSLAPVVLSGLYSSTVSPGAATCGPNTQPGPGFVTKLIYRLVAVAPGKQPMVLGIGLSYSPNGAKISETELARTTVTAVPNRADPIHLAFRGLPSVVRVLPFSRYGSTSVPFALSAHGLVPGIPYTVHVLVPDHTPLGIEGGKLDWSIYDMHPVGQALFATGVYEPAGPRGRMNWPVPLYFNGTGTGKVRLTAVLLVSGIHTPVARSTFTVRVLPARR